MFEMMNARQLAFNQTHRPMGKALADEIRRRLGVSPTSRTGYDAGALDYGHLAGAQPIMDAAFMLDKLAQSLPD